MKSWISAVALTAFLSIALVGFSQFSMEGGKCVAETYAGTVCHVMTTAERSSFHISAFTGFLSSIGGNTFATLLSLAMLMVIAVLMLVLYRAPVLVPVFAYRKPQTLSPPSKGKLLRFLALFEHSPSSH